MNTLKKLSACAVIVLVLFPKPSYGLFGVGDVVFDPANVAQAINLLHQAQQEFDRLGSLLGVSVSQYDQLLALVSALGNSAEAAKFATPLSTNELQKLVSATPGLEQADTVALFNANGELGAFIGKPVSTWAERVESPTQAYSGLLTTNAASRASESGAPVSAQSYLQWFNGLTPEDRANLGANAPTDISNLLTTDWLASSRQRRTNIFALASANQAASMSAQATNSAADRENAQAKLISNTNQILLEAATQSLDANEASVRATNAQLAGTERAREHQHNIGVMQLDGSN